MKNQIHILVVDENPTVHLQFRDMSQELVVKLQGRQQTTPTQPTINFVVDSVFDLFLAQKLIKRHYAKPSRFCLAVVSIETFDLQRLDLIRQLRDFDPDLYIIVLGHTEPHLKRDITHYLNFDNHIIFLDKPLVLAEAIKLLEDLICSWNLRQELQVRLHKQLSEDQENPLVLFGSLQLPKLLHQTSFMEAVISSLSDGYIHHRNVAVAILEVDHFNLNQQFSALFLHKKLLIEISQRLNSFCKSSWLLGYLSENKFAVLLPDVQDELTCYNQLLQLQSNLAAPYQILGGEVIVSFSVGVSLSHNKITDAQELLSYGETALYLSKQKGRSFIEFYRPETQQQLVRSLTLEAALKQALDRDEFRLVYQPIFALDTQTVSGVEALLRWQHPELGMLLPRDFLDVAEQTGLIGQIGTWVINEACRQLNLWQKHFHLNVKMAVNLSASQFSSGNIINILQKAIFTHGILPQNLELEITEQQLLDATQDVFKDINTLSQVGYNLVIDDFGVGYSSLQYLNILPVSKIKIDRSFILKNSKKDRDVLKAILQLAQQLNLKTLCEGIETQEQFDHIKKLNCDEVQGFLLGLPIIPDDIPAFIVGNTKQPLMRHLNY